MLHIIDEVLFEDNAFCSMSAIEEAFKRNHGEAMAHRVICALRAAQVEKIDERRTEK
ncbi:hypothetical protein NX009_10875 [Klebsiella pneumoniae]|nr:hypothetical protein [Klebsiella pneumoniae]